MAHVRLVNSQLSRELLLGIAAFFDVLQQVAVDLGLTLISSASDGLKPRFDPLLYCTYN